MSERALIHIAGPVGLRQKTFAETLRTTQTSDL